VPQCSVCSGPATGSPKLAQSDSFINGILLIERDYLTIGLCRPAFSTLTCLKGVAVQRTCCWQRQHAIKTFRALQSAVNCMPLSIYHVSPNRSSIQTLADETLLRERKIGGHADAPSPIQPTNATGGLA